MTDKDRVIQATDRIAEALSALIRINYFNDAQANRNTNAAAALLLKAVALLKNETEGPIMK